MTIRNLCVWKFHVVSRRDIGEKQALQGTLGEQDGQAVDDGVTTGASHTNDGACFDALDFETQGCVTHGADEVLEVLFGDGWC